MIVLRHSSSFRRPVRPPSSTSWSSDSDISAIPVKAYTNLGLAQLALDRPGEALSSSTTAYRFAIEQRSPSVASIAATCMEAKKKRWEQMERRRIEREGTLLKEMTDIIERDADKQVDKILRRGLMGDTAGFEGSTVRVLEEEVRQEAREKVKTLEDVFGKAEAERCLRREVPDYLVDTITFNIMSDPVIVCPHLPGVGGGFGWL